MMRTAPPDEQQAHAEYQPGNDDAPAGDFEGDGWPDPHPLTAKIAP